MHSLDTRISLPPGVLPTGVVHELLKLSLEEFQWFKPVRYGRASLTGHLDAATIDYDALLAIYEEHKDLTVAARTDRDFFLLWSNKADSLSSTGGITWCTSVTEAKSAAWRKAHLHQVQRVMHLVGSPYAYAGITTDVERKKSRLVPSPDGIGQVETLTVRDYSEGLAGLFWRNFFGPPFVRLFGEALASLPPDTRQDLGEGITLVQPYTLPTQAGTPEGEARERELIAHLGPECFYDHARHRTPTRLPQL
jgi:hypothetical protein